MTQSGERSISAGRDMIDNQAITGDHNIAGLTITKLPDTASVDIATVLAELHTMLTDLRGPDSAKVGRAFDDAKEELAKPEPDKAEVVGILSRAIDYAKKAADFSGHVEKIKPLIIQIAGWIGPAAGPLLASVGLSAVE